MQSLTSGGAVFWTNGSDLPVALTWRRAQQLHDLYIGKATFGLNRQPHVV
jgi:hypothetical protein